MEQTLCFHTFSIEVLVVVHGHAGEDRCVAGHGGGQAGGAVP